MASAILSRSDWTCYCHRNEVVLVMGLGAISAGCSQGPVMRPIIKVQAGDHFNSQQECSYNSHIQKQVPIYFHQWQTEDCLQGRLHSKSNFLQDRYKHYDKHSLYNQHSSSILAMLTQSIFWAPHLITSDCNKEKKCLWGSILCKNSCRQGHPCFHSWGQIRKVLPTEQISLHIFCDNNNNNTNNDKPPTASPDVQNITILIAWRKVVT